MPPPVLGAAVEEKRSLQLVMLRSIVFQSMLALGEGEVPQITLVFRLARRK
jgi:hypothetical protein